MTIFPGTSHRLPCTLVLRDFYGISVWFGLNLRNMVDKAERTVKALAMAFLKLQSFGKLELNDTTHISNGKHLNKGTEKPFILKR